MGLRTAPYLLQTLLLCTVAMTTAASAFAAPVTPANVAAKIEQIMKDHWNCRNLQVRVQPFANDSLTQSGRFQAIVVEAQAISRKGITVAPFYVKAFDVTLDLNRMYGRNEIRSARRKNTILNARIAQSDINKLLAQKEMAVKNPRVQFGSGTLTLTGQYQALMGHNLQMVAKVQVVDKSKLNLVPTSVRVNGVPLPAGPVRSLLGGINPMLDLTEIPLSPTLESVTITPQALILKG